MEPQHPRPSRPQHPHLLSLLPTTPVSSPASPSPLHSGHRLPAGVASSSSPGVFSPSGGSPSPRPSSHAMVTAASIALPESTTTTPLSSPHQTLHPSRQHLPVRETHIANVDRHYATGRKMINEYEVLEEIGRGQHGKVKLARNSLTGELVAIKIIPRLSKTRRLGKVSAADPQQNTKREIAILKKIRHDNVVALLEVIDDPELQKIYMVLEHVERGEVIWRKKGLPSICFFERYRIERCMRGASLAPGECNWHDVLDRKATVRALREARAAGLPPPVNRWTTEYGVTADDEDDGQPPWWYLPDNGPAPDNNSHTQFFESPDVSQTSSRVPSRVPSSTSVSSSGLASRSCGSEASPLSMVANDGDLDCDAPCDQPPRTPTAPAPDGNPFGSYVDEVTRLRQRSPSVVTSVISNMSSIDDNAMVHDPYADDFSYVPCFSIEQARSAFRDTVLGLEYLHYHGVVHRDIKPANLLWTRNFHVKISDFGVSYFGRPIRDGEPDSSVSESEAVNFDDDRELSKTVGTPAFFSPELCYTDLDKEPPKVSEQIDVWSLGVTLYCLLFARIPFLAEDEFSMFRKIATEEPVIPYRRLKPVGIFTDPTGSSLYQRTNVHPAYRNDADPEYEELSDSVLDLLSKMLIKNPEKRIRLRDVKRHRWVTEDISNVPAWLEGTDPAHSQGCDIHVDDAEIGEAVVPLNFLQRARSAVKRAVDKVIHPRPDRDEAGTPASASRRRAASSAASSAGDVSPASLHLLSLHHKHSSGSGGLHGLHGLHSHHHHGNTHPRDERRPSLRGDDYFSTVTQMPSEHPLSQSQTASPYASPGESTPNSEFTQQLMPLGEPTPTRHQLATPDVRSGSGSAISSLDGTADDASVTAALPASELRPLVRHVHSRSISNAVLSRSSIMREVRSMAPTLPPLDTTTRPSVAALRAAQETRTSPTSASPASRAQSVDRAAIVFSKADKRAGPVVGLNTETAPGNLHQPARALRQHPNAFVGLNDGYMAAAFASPSATASSRSTSRPSRSVEPSFYSSHSSQATTPASTLVQPLFSYSEHSGEGTRGRQNEQRPRREQSAAAYPGQPVFSAVENNAPTGELPQQVDTQQPVERGLAESVSRVSSPKAVVSTVEKRDQRQDGRSSRRGSGYAIRTEIANSSSGTALTEASSSTASFGAFNTTPLTSPDDVPDEPIAANPGGKEGYNTMSTFQSDPSLPALLSGASSVSADMEGEFLGNPGVVNSTTLVEAADTLTPPALSKEDNGFPLDHGPESSLKDQQPWGSCAAISVPVQLDSREKAALGTPVASPVRGMSRSFQDDAGDSDSDGGVVMMARTRKRSGGLSRHVTPVAHGSRTQMARRRDTNTSIESTDTAKKVPTQDDN